MANFTHANILFAHCLPPRNIYTFIHEPTHTKNTFKKGANWILVIIVSDLFFLNS